MTALTRLLFVLTVALAGCAGDEARPAAAQLAATETEAPLGATVFAQRCEVCHKADGRGVEGRYPPLAGSEIVLGRPERPAAILLHGLTGPVEVAGETFDDEMPALYGASDAAAAAVLSYVRTAWGNDAEPVEGALVARVREQTRDRTEPWTWDELDAYVASLGAP